MSHDESESTWLPLAIAELVDRDEQLLSQLEGLLVLSSGRDELVTPTGIASQTDLSISTVVDVFRQLSRTDAIERELFETTIANSTYRVSVNTCRQIFETARYSARSITAYQERQPPTTKATPLVTFPADPAFENVNPTSFGMSWLMPTLTRQVKQTDEAITLLVPFFEADGFAHLKEVLTTAMKRGVDVTVVSRYLTDPTSYNYAVLKSFAKTAIEGDIDTSHLTFVDYTRWDAGTPSEEQRQDGAIPAFTLHAKVILFDDSAVYIGSANVTDYGFEQYLETGILLEGPPVAGFSELISFLLDSDAATSVSLV
ncbi:phospholipase D-like domain-containing protein [Haladaptatus sp. AB618]|uniref:phospholipase D-like domain-containing protein n=1 Tax=Haladaptatus sp. AB618 TaxID=2934173 RepID=UPI00209BF643|nr:phospholipase D-like domain-containing protein [Haladaptatus sp. AB618]MCO8256744.1 phospholipase D-like domain-containing protein [Haladaptatus sp. AB618]